MIGIKLMVNVRVGGCVGYGILACCFLYVRAGISTILSFKNRREHSHGWRQFQASLFVRKGKS